MDEYDNLTAKTLKSWRNRLGLTQAEAANWFGIARATFINWEGGGPISRGAGSICRMALKRWKMRDLFGPVTLVYTDEPMWQSAFGVPKVPMMQHQYCRNNYDAIHQACTLRALQKVNSAFIMDEEGDVVWNMKELREECAVRSTGLRRIPVITTHEAKTYRRHNKVLEVDVLPIANKPGWRDVQYHLAMPTGDEDDNFDLQQPVMQPGPVRVDLVDKVIQEAAHVAEAAYIVKTESH